MTRERSVQARGVQINAAGDGAAAPEWVQLTPAGDRLNGVDGRSWPLTDPERLIELFASEGQTLPIDLNHSTEIKGTKGEPSPAVGWIVGMELRDGAIWGKVDWNAAGRAAVEAREYRYLSPVFWVEKGSNRIERFRSAALTNNPNFHMAALNTAVPTEETSMNLAEIRKALGLADDADEAAIVTAINSQKTRHETALNAARSAPDPEKFVPMATHKAVLNRAEAAESSLKDIEAKGAEAEIETAINAAIEAKKIAPADREFYVASCRAEGGLERFKAFVEKTPAKISETGLDGKQPGEGGQALTAEEVAACQAMGVTQAEFIKAKAAEKEEA